MALQRLATFNSLSVQMRFEERPRMEGRTIVCYLGGIWRRLEPLERNYGRFLSVDPSGRFAGVSSLGKPLYIEKSVYLKSHINGSKSARELHRRDVEHILSKVSCFLSKYFHFRRLQKRQVFSHTNPYKSRLCLIVRVNVALNRTVVVNSD